MIDYPWFFVNGKMYLRGITKMIDPEQKRVLILAVKAGEMMMESGAEIYRVEDTITRICKACHIAYVDVFATPTGIFVTLDSGDKESDVFTYVRRIKSSSVNLSVIADINRFSREFTTTDMTVEEGLDVLDEIEKHRRYSTALRIFAAALISASFCGIFDGTPAECLMALIVGALGYSLSLLLDKFESNFFMHGLVSSFMAALFAELAAAIGIAESAGPIIIGAIMIFVPGVAITNAIRDFLSGDMLSGLARLGEAIITAVSLAIGAGLMLELWSILGGVI